MYRVIEMYGDFEPWWFIEGWEEDVISSKTFENYYDALKYYKSCWFELEKKIPLYKSRGDLMTIFWNPEDKRWCEECDEFLQQYHSLALLEDIILINKGNLHRQMIEDKIGLFNREITVAKSLLTMTV